MRSIGNQKVGQTGEADRRKKIARMERKGIG